MRPLRQATNDSPHSFHSPYGLLLTIGESMNKINLFFLALALASLACIETTIATIDEKSVTSSAPSAVPAASLSQEPESGAVFEILSPQTASAAADKTKCATVTAIEALHMRAEPSELATVIDWLRAGQIVTVRLKDSDWWMIEAEGKTGYAKAKYLQESECE